MDLLTPVDLHVLFSTLNNKMSDEELNKYVTPMRMMPKYERWIRNKVESGYTVLLVGGDVSEFMKMIEQESESLDVRKRGIKYVLWIVLVPPNLCRDLSASSWTIMKRDGSVHEVALSDAFMTGAPYWDPGTDWQNSMFDCSFVDRISRSRGPIHRRWHAIDDDGANELRLVVTYGCESGYHPLSVDSRQVMYDRLYPYRMKARDPNLKGLIPYSMLGEVYEGITPIDCVIRLMPHDLYSCEKASVCRTQDVIEAAEESGDFIMVKVAEKFQIINALHSTRLMIGRTAWHTMDVR